jgi:hypothetical protein
VEVMGRRRRRPEQLLNDLKEWRWYCKLKEEALDRTVCRSHVGSDGGPVVRQTDEWMKWSYISSAVGCPAVDFTSKLDEAVTILASLRVVPSSNLVLAPTILAAVFLIFPQFLQKMPNK